MPGFGVDRWVVPPRHGCPMTRSAFTFECTEAQAAVLRRTLALQEELEHLALTAPDGTVFDACEAAVIDRGRDLQRDLLSDAVNRRIEAAEKGGADPGLSLRPGQGEPGPKG